jgi:predicted 3-demethylubiquinone-9 3-methyltransferase (glyoxalase superfamily)
LPIQKITPFLWFDSQAEEAAGGSDVQCGWLKDKFGLSWQVVPTVLSQLLSDPDPQKSQRVMKALMTMKKLDIRALKLAFDNP